MNWSYNGLFWKYQTVLNICLKHYSCIIPQNSLYKSTIYRKLKFSTAVDYLIRKSIYGFPEVTIIWGYYSWAAGCYHYNAFCDALYDGPTKVWILQWSLWATTKCLFPCCYFLNLTVSYFIVIASQSNIFTFSLDLPVNVPSFSSLSKRWFNGKWRVLLNK